jgi:hypothetical protein
LVFGHGEERVGGWWTKSDRLLATQELAAREIVMSSGEAVLTEIGLGWTVMGLLLTGGGVLAIVEGSRGLSCILCMKKVGIWYSHVVCSH